MRVRTAPTRLDCVDTTDRVFEREGLLPASGVAGNVRLYVPRTTPNASFQLRWGIAVVIDGEQHGDRSGQCTFDLQALSADPGCGMNCPLTPQPGGQFDEQTRKLAGLLSEAFGGLGAVPLGGGPRSAAATRAQGPSAFGLVPVNVAADPCSDFASYACGAEASWGKLRPESDVLAWRTAAVWRFLDELAAGKHQDGEPETALLKDFYARCRDPRARGAGLDDVHQDLTRIDRARTLADLARILGELGASGTQILIWFGITEDDERGQGPFVGRFGLKAPWLATRKNAGNPTTAADLHEHWERLAALTHAASAAEVDAALEVDAAIERDRSASKATAAERPLDRASFRASRFPWKPYLEGLGVPDTLPVIPMNAVLTRADKLTDVPLDKLKSYARLTLLDVSARYLGEAFATEEARFHHADATEGGAMIAEIAPVCVALTGNLLGPQLAEAYLPTLAEGRWEATARDLFEGLRDRFERSLEATEWLDPGSRHAARAKLRAVALRFIDDTDDARPIEPLPPGSLLSAMHHVARSTWNANAGDLTGEGPSSKALRATFLMGAYSPRLNSIWMSPEIVRPPFLRNGAGDPATLGALGTIIGHELGHVLSPSGRRFDASGSFRETWSPDAVAAFDGRAACLGRQEAKMTGHGREQLPWPKADESIADLVGVDLASRLLEAGVAPPRTADKLTVARKQFFLAYAQMTCALGRLTGAERARRGDPHQPPRARINGTVANIPAFGEAFACRPSAPLNPPDRCTLW
jgi:predicted metalloendopeptidase